MREELDASFVKRIGKNSKIIPIVLDDCAVPECLQSTVWENINDHQNYEENFTRIIMKTLKLTTLLALTFFTACSQNDQQNDEEPPTASCLEARDNLVSEIKAEMQSVNYDTPYTLNVQTKSGRRITYSVGDSSAQTLYVSASTSKLVGATVILDVVMESNLTLESHPQDFIDAWPNEGELSKITLSQLLSFTSGLNEKPDCMKLFRDPKDFKSCVLDVATANEASPVEAGSTFFYGPTHLQVAALMAINASQKSSWAELFAAFKTKTGLFTHSAYDIPSTENPRIAAGMHWIADDYEAFLGKLYHKEILTETLLEKLFKDQRATATTLNSPALDGIGEDWHYGYGNWIECHANTFNCEDEVNRVSTPGLYGAYPFIDFEHAYYGILARQGAYATFTKGYEIFEQLSPKLERWATMECD